MVLTEILLYISPFWHLYLRFFFGGGEGEVGYATHSALTVKVKFTIFLMLPCPSSGGSNRLDSIVI